MTVTMRNSETRSLYWAGPLLVYLTSLSMLILSKTVSNTRYLLVALGFEFLVFALPLSVMTLIVKRVEKDKLWSSTGFTRIPVVKVVLFSLALYFSVFISTWLLFRAAEYLAPTLPEVARYDPTALGEAFRGLPAIAYWYIIFTGVVYAGFGEEILFRGYVLTRLLRRGLLFSVIASSIMWSSLHLWYIPILGSTGIWQHLQVIITGLIFGVAFAKMRNLIPIIAVHGYANILLPLSFLYPGPALSLTTLIVLLAGFAATLILLIRQLLARVKSRSSMINHTYPTASITSDRQVLSLS